MCQRPDYICKVCGLTWLLWRAPRIGLTPQLSHSTSWCTWGPSFAALLRALLSASVFCAFPLGTPANARISWDASSP